MIKSCFHNWKHIAWFQIETVFFMSIAVWFFSIFAKFDSSLIEPQHRKRVEDLPNGVVAVCVNQSKVTVDTSKNHEYFFSDCSYTHTRSFKERIRQKETHLLKSNSNHGLDICSCFLYFSLAHTPKNLCPNCKSRFMRY